MPLLCPPTLLLALELYYSAAQAAACINSNGNLLATRTIADARIGPDYEVVSSSETDADGTGTSISCDALNRPLTKSYSGVRTGPATRYCYDGQIWSVTTGVCGAAAPAITNSLMRLTELWTADSSTRYTGFDAVGRVTASRQSTTGWATPFDFTYTHNYAGGLKSVTYPSGRVVTNSFDAAGRITGLAGQLGAASTAYAGSLTYVAHGALKQLQFGNTLYESWDHSATRLQPRRVSLGTTAGAVDRGSLEFAFCNAGTYTSECAANNGNLLGQKIYTGGATASFTQTYSYDGLNRLKSAVESGASSSSEGYDYDRFGNLWWTTPSAPGTNKPCTAGVTGCLHVNSANNQLDGGSYDAAGNRLGMGPMGMVYDAEGRVTKVTATGTGDAQYVYDGMGKRVRATQLTGTTVVSDTVFAYDAGGNLAAEYGPAWAETGTWYLTGDHLGSTRMMARGAAEVRRFDYAPFGEEMAGGGRTSGLGYGQVGPRQKFTGKERDAETGLDYFGARYMSAAQGRFTTPDEWAGGIVDPFTGGQVGVPGPLPYADITDPQTINKYAYVRNNPLRYVDPDGHDLEEVAFGVVEFAAGVGRGIAASESFGVVGAPQSSDSISSRAGQAVGTLVAGVVGTTTSAGGAAVAVGSAGTLALAGGAVAVKGVATALGAAKNLGAMLNAPIQSSGNPSLSDHKEALAKVHAEVGKQPKGEPGKFGSPQAGNKKTGYRLDPAHPTARPGSAETQTHINWWDYTKGKKNKGAVPVGPAGAK